MNHTPGPWKAFGRTVYAGETPVALGIAEFDAEVAPVYANDARHPLKEDDEGEANARLIAAAPDLLEALQVIAAGRIGDHGSLCSLEQLQEIAKASIKATLPNGGAR